MNELRESSFSELLLFFVGRRKRAIVTGDSMRPTLRPNDQIAYAPHHTPAVGNIVIAQHPTDSTQKIIKRVIVIRDETVYLRGDNPAASTDYPAVPHSNILGVVTSRL